MIHYRLEYQFQNKNIQVMEDQKHHCHIETQAKGWWWWINPCLAFQCEGGLGEVEDISLTSKHESKGWWWVSKPPISCFDVREGQGGSWRPSRIKTWTKGVVVGEQTPYLAFWWEVKIPPHIKTQAEGVVSKPPHLMFRCERKFGEVKNPLLMSECKLKGWWWWTNPLSCVSMWERIGGDQRHPPHIKKWVEAWRGGGGWLNPHILCFNEGGLGKVKDIPPCIKTQVKGVVVDRQTPPLVFQCEGGSGRSKMPPHIKTWAEGVVLGAEHACLCMCLSRGHWHWKKRPGVDFFFKATFSWTN